MGALKPIRVYLWHRWWVWGWTVLLAATVAVAAVLEWYWWIPLAILTFLAPELWAIAHEPSATPPLTSILRRYVPSWAAFPLLAGCVGFVTTALLNDRAWMSLAIALASGVAGWGVEHFVTTYFRLERKPRRWRVIYWRHVPEPREPDRRQAQDGRRPLQDRDDRAPEGDRTLDHGERGGP